MQRTSPLSFATMAVGIALCWAVAQAESIPPLEKVVERDVLIVKCKTEIKDDAVHYRVLETWKGNSSPEVFYHTPPKGYLHLGIELKSFGSAKEGLEVIMFYSDNAISGDVNNPGKIDAYRPDLVLPIENGKVEWERGELVSTIYTLGDFQKAVLAIVAKDKKSKEPR